MSSFPTQGSYDQVFALANQHKLTVYDAAYLDLAMREAAKIASLDKGLVRAATQARLSLFKP